MSPQRTDLVLTADIPDVELGVLVCDGLDVEADGGDGGDVLVELELVEDSCTRTCQSMSPHRLLMNKRVRRYEGNVLVFPAASRPSINSRISLDPKILAIILDIDAPILSIVCRVAA